MVEENRALRFLTGVIDVVVCGPEVRPSDAFRVTLPEGDHRALSII
jgi:hypothetical protein